MGNAVEASAERVAITFAERWPAAETYQLKTAGNTDT